jgi:hypothetical protein
MDSLAAHVFPVVLDLTSSQEFLSAADDISLLFLLFFTMLPFIVASRGLALVVTLEKFLEFSLCGMSREDLLATSQKKSS